MTNTTKLIPVGERVKITEKGLRGFIVDRDKPLNHRGVVTAHDNEYLCVIVDGKYTVHSYNPSFWEHDPGYVRPPPQFHENSLSGIQEKINRCYPGTEVTMTEEGKKRYPYCKHTGTVLGWTWRFKPGVFGKNMEDHVRVLCPGNKTPYSHHHSWWEATPCKNEQTDASPQL